MECVTGTYKLADLDRSVKHDIMDLIDYNYRFRKDVSESLQDVINELRGDIDSKIAKFYSGITDLNFDISVEDLEEEYRITMM